MKRPLCQVNARCALVTSAIFAFLACTASSLSGCPNEGLESGGSIQKLRRFMESHGANVSHLCVKQSPSGGRGLFSNQPLHAQQPIFSVPEDAIMDPVKPRPGDVASVMRKHSPKPITDALMFFILACRRLDRCSKHWSALLQSFPPPSEMHLPSLWRSSERELLKGTNAYLSLEREDRTISQSYDTVNAALRASQLPDAAADEVRYIHAIIVSRAFDLKFPGRENITRVLIPFVDLFNHSPGVEILYEFESVGLQQALRFKVSTNASVAIDSEVFVNYGNSDSSSGSMFLQYGMSVPASAFDNFQIMPSIAHDSLFDAKQEALRAAGIDVNVPDAALSISLSGDVPGKLLCCVAVLTSNQTYTQRLNDIAQGHFLPKSLEIASLKTLSQGISSIMDGFPSDFESVERVHPVRLALVRHQVKLEKLILSRCALEQRRRALLLHALHFFIFAQGPEKNKKTGAHIGAGAGG